MSAPIAEGAMAVMTRDVQDLGRDFSGNYRTRHKGMQFIVEDYVPAEEAEDGVAFYYGSAEGGINNIAVPADAVEQTMTPAEVRNRKLPSLRALGAYLCHLDQGDGFEFDEGDYSGIKDDPQNPEQAQLELYGTTDEGLRFAMAVQIVALYEADF